MAASTLPEPGKVVRGTEIGPCVDPCEHTDCAQTREMAASICRFCNEPIGYEVRFYTDPDNKEHLVHALCLEISISKEDQHETH